MTKYLKVVIYFMLVFLATCMSSQSSSFWLSSQFFKIFKILILLRSLSITGIGAGFQGITWACIQFHDQCIQFQELACSYRSLHAVHAVSRGFSRLPKVTQSYQKLPKVTHSYPRLPEVQGITWACIQFKDQCIQFQELACSYRSLHAVHAVPRGYPRSPKVIQGM